MQVDNFIQVDINLDPLTNECNSTVHFLKFDSGNF